jgi:hypothetical protein
MPIFPSIHYKPYKQFGTAASRLPVTGRLVCGAVETIRHFRYNQEVYASCTGTVDDGCPTWTAVIKKVNNNNTYTILYKTDRKTLENVPWDWITDLDHQWGIAIRTAYKMKIK